jgi:hypothetical protein
MNSTVWQIFAAQQVLAASQVAAELWVVCCRLCAILRQCLSVLVSRAKPANLRGWQGLLLQQMASLLVSARPNGLFACIQPADGLPAWSHSMFGCYATMASKLNVHVACPALAVS